MELLLDLLAYQIKDITNGQLVALPFLYVELRLIFILITKNGVIGSKHGKKVHVPKFPFLNMTILHKHKKVDWKVTSTF